MANYACVIDWRLHPFRRDRWLEAWLPAAERAMSFGASGWSLTRAVDDPLHFRQTIMWEEKEHFDLYWASDEVAAIREQVMSYYNKPLLPTWHTMIAHAGVTAEEEELVASSEE
jgi:hypothetical protein